MAPLHFLGQDDKHKVKHYFFGHVTPLALANKQMMPIVFSVAPVYFLGQDNQNEVQHDFNHLIPLALVSVSHAANSIIKALLHSFDQDN